MKVYKQSTEGEKRIGKLNAALDDTEEVLKRFGKEIFKEFIHDDYTGLRIYIVASIKAEDSLSGYAVRWYDKYTVISDTFDYKRTLYHELMHSMEDNLYAKNKNAFNKWMSLNPKKYNYKGDYSPYALTYEYSVGYFNNKEYYFIDNYSQTNGLEDKARIFENICMNTVDDIKNNPKILKKAEYIRDELLKYFPMLKESNIFDSLN